MPGGSSLQPESRLRDLVFLVDDVLARHRVVLLDLELLGLRLRVLRRRVEVTRVGGRNQFDQHPRHGLLRPFLHVPQDFLDTHLVDGLNRLRGDLQPERGYWVLPW